MVVQGASVSLVFGGRGIAGFPGLRAKSPPAPNIAPGNEARARPVKPGPARVRVGSAMAISISIGMPAGTRRTNHWSRRLGASAVFENVWVVVWFSWARLSSGVRRFRPERWIAEYGVRVCGWFSFEKVEDVLRREPDAERRGEEAASSAGRVNLRTSRWRECRHRVLRVIRSVHWAASLSLSLGH